MRARGSARLLVALSLLLVAIAARGCSGRPEPTEALLQFQRSMRSSYWEGRDLPSAIRIAEAGIEYGQEAAHANEDLAQEVLPLLKGLHFDLASFTWPGWNEPGIVISPAQQARGREAARENLALALKLERGPLAQSRAHWMVGAHELAAQDFQTAVESFERAAALADQAGVPGEEHLGLAFRALARLCTGEGQAHVDLARELEVLRSIDGGSDFADQVEVASSALRCGLRSRD